MVPIITLSGLSKRFLLPGWRFGWLALHDPSNHALQVKEALNQLANRILGPNSLVQAALPDILSTPDEWFTAVIEKVKVGCSNPLADEAIDMFSTTPASQPGS